MEEVKRVEEILEKSSLSRVEVAKRLGVSIKTLGSWLGGKSVPRGKNVESIRRVYNEIFGKRSSRKVGEAKVKESQEVMTLKEMLLKHETRLVESEEVENEKKEQTIYYDGKKIVLTLEKKNQDKLLLFPSKGDLNGEWYKMGGNSALFYMYYIAPRLKKKPKLRQDTDIRCRFKDGVISVHFIDRFIENMESLGLKVRKDEYKIVIVKLEQSFTVAEIKEMKGRAAEEEKRFHQILMPKENFPDMYNSIRKLAQLLVPKIKHMDGAYRQILGDRFLGLVMDAYEIYYRMTNGSMTKEEGKKAMRVKIDEMKGLVMLADEVEWFDFTTRTRVGEALVDLQVALERRLGETDSD